MEAEARPERPFVGGGPLLFPRRRPGQICHLWRVRCSPESRRAFPELATVVAVAAPVHGVLVSPPTSGEVLLVKISGSLQVGSSPSSAISVGWVEEGWWPAVTAAWRRLEADFLSASRSRCLRRVDSAAAQQGWSTALLRCEVCVVVLSSSSSASSSLVFVRVCAVLV